MSLYILNHIFKPHHPSFFNQSTAQIDSDSTGPWPSLETIDKGPKFTDRGAHCNCSCVWSWWQIWPLFPLKCPPRSASLLPSPRWAVTQTDRWMATMFVQPFYHPGPLELKGQYPSKTTTFLLWKVGYSILGVGKGSSAHLFAQISTIGNWSIQWTSWKLIQSVTERRLPSGRERSRNFI